MNKQLCVVLLLLTSSLALTATAGSTRVEVYPLSQTYIDTREGDTLSELVADLLPHNSELQRLLMRDILLRNPHAFPGSSIDTMLANERRQDSRSREPQGHRRHLTKCQDNE